MNRLWIIPDASRPPRFLLRCFTNPRRISKHRLPALAAASDCRLFTESVPGTACSPSSSSLRRFANLFSNQFSSNVKAREDRRMKLSRLTDELIRSAEDPPKAAELLEEKGGWLVRSHGDGSALVELCDRLGALPSLAMEVFNWRWKKQGDSAIPMTPEEYAQGISIASKIDDLDLASELFTEAGSKCIRTAVVYNALMKLHLRRRDFERCRALFQELRSESGYAPDAGTYNIVISLFGRLMLVDQMEAAFCEMVESDLAPNRRTYNSLLAGYLVAWMWNSMEETLGKMMAAGVTPDVETESLMLRGYAHSRNLARMEEAYDAMKDRVKKESDRYSLIRVMITAYCRCSASDGAEKVESLSRLIPEEEYRPWLNVVLIGFYAREGRAEAMEDSINEAFERGTRVRGAGIMRAIVASYLRGGAWERLVGFARRAEGAGWRVCRCLYHGKMVACGFLGRWEEMEGVAEEMQGVGLRRTKRTLLIMYSAYLRCARRRRAESVAAMMCRRAYGFPSDAFHAARRFPCEDTQNYIKERT